jgi:hypothetical protein
MPVVFLEVKQVRPEHDPTGLALVKHPQLPDHKKCILKYLRRPSPGGRRPGRIEHMSTQRRESSSTLATNTRRRGPRCGFLNCWQHTNSTHREGADGLVSLAPVTRRACASTTLARPCTTVEPVAISLQKNPRFVGPISHDSPLPRTASLGQLCSQGTNRYSPSLISVLSGSPRFHLALPQAPAGVRHWAERYDGQGNLHFKHAA